MSNIITLEKAGPSDVADLAILDNIASHGLSHWYWQKAVGRGEAGDAYEWGRQRMGDENASFGYKNAVMARINGVAAGVCVSYLTKGDEAVPEKSKDPVIKPVFELFSLCMGDWWLDNLAVYSSARRRGVGATLLDDCFSRAKKAGAARLSLVAEDTNTDALSLYASRGMMEKDRREFVPFAKSNNTKYWLLLIAPVN
ncbi:MAG: GNAT family N-acetyltransferase [Rhizobiaceae bacterium]|nr:GNAT family N-acetyltransferase [Rhizobiaceae bacterium]